MSDQKPIFNPPPGWPKPPDNWTPPLGWKPDPAWPDPPDGWQLWLPAQSAVEPSTDALQTPVADQTKTVDEALYLRTENTRLREQLAGLSARSDAVVLDDDAVLQEVGIYQYHHPLENAVAYKDRLRDLNSRIADLIKAGHAIEKSNMFTFDNSLAKGRKMTQNLSKLMLRAYNAEADNCLRSLRAGNVATAKKRMERTKDSIAKLGLMMEMHISDEFHSLRIEEIELTADFLMKKQEEKEADREHRAQLREQRKVEMELAEERQRLDKERRHIANTLETLRESGATDSKLLERLSEIDDAIAQNDFRAANVRAGYVYVISNRGAFGPGVVKIGLTRRLEPLERIAELSGAAVPFRFDVHGLFFSEDAVTLETELHQQFANRKLNCVNSRKEFFFATPAEVRDVLASKVGNLVEFTEHAESLEFMQSLKYWPDQPNTEMGPRIGPYANKQASTDAQSLSAAYGG